MEGVIDRHDEKLSVSNLVAVFEDLNMRRTRQAQNSKKKTEKMAVEIEEQVVKQPAAFEKKIRATQQSWQKRKQRRN